MGVWHICTHSKWANLNGKWARRNSDSASGVGHFRGRQQKASKKT